MLFRSHASIGAVDADPHVALESILTTLILDGERIECEASARGFGEERRAVDLVGG